MIKIALSLIFILVSQFIFSESPPTTASTTIPTANMAEICAFDKRCRYAFSDNGQIYPIKPEVGYITANFHETIVLAAQRYGVDPRAIAGAILAENTMNVQLDDSIQEFLARNGVTSIGSKSFSYGLGQLNEGAAMEAENYMAKLENRPPRSWDEITKAILDPKETIQLIAGYMRYAQDTYKSHGHDISGRPDILATLYNLGDIETKANLLTPESQPQVNFFGAFVANNMTSVENVIGWSPDKGKYKPTYINNASFNLNHRNRPPIELHSRPPTCTTNQTTLQMADVTRSQTFNGFRSTGKLVGWYQITNESIDCEMQRWVLVNGLNGESGWVNHYELEEKSSQLPLPGGIMGSFRDSNCRKNQNTCLEKIAGITGTTVEAASLGLLNITVNTHEGVTTPSMKNFNSECLANQLKINVQGNNSTTANNEIILNGIQLPRIEKLIEDKKKEIMAGQGVTNWRKVDRDLQYAFERIDSALSYGKDYLRSSTRGRSNTKLIKIGNNELQAFLNFDSSLQVTLTNPTTPNPTNNTTRPSFGNPTGNSNNNNTGSSYSSRNRNPAFDNALRDLYRASDRLLRDYHTLAFKPAASAPNVADLSQPLGPVSAPRGTQARIMTEEIRRRRESRAAIQSIFSKCTNYASDGMTENNFQVYFENESFQSYAAYYLSRISQSCELFDAIESNTPLDRNLSSCDSQSCMVFYINETGELDRNYFTHDHIKKYKDLLNPHEVIKAYVERAKSRLDRELPYYNSSQTNNSNNTDYSRNCSYDPITTNQKIEQISKLDCVNNIQVPQGELFNHNERYKTNKVILGIFESDTQYQVTINKCIQNAYTGPPQEAESTESSADTSQ